MVKLHRHSGIFVTRAVVDKVITNTCDVICAVVRFLTVNTSRVIGAAIIVNAGPGVQDRRAKIHRIYADK